MRIAITGSSGFIGTALRNRLEAGGHDVLRVLRGEPNDERALWQPAKGWFRDGALEGIDAVVHLTGASIGARRWTEARRQLIWSSRVEATRVLVQHLGTLSSRPKVLVSASAVGYYGDRGDEELTEESPPGKGFLADLCVAWEAEARAAEGLGMRTVQTRSGIVISSPDFLPRVARPFRLGLGATLGDGRQWMSWVTLGDALRTIEFALLHAELSGPVNVAAPPVTNREFTKALGRAVRRPAVLRLPAFALRLMFGRQLTDEALLASQRAAARRIEGAGFTFVDRFIEAAFRDGLAH